VSSQTSPTQDSSSRDEREVRELYQRLLDAWNNRNPAEMAALFEEDGNVVGFDGSQVIGRPAIASEMAQIFANHQTPPYVAKTREVRLLTPEVSILRAVAGMIPPGKSDIDPALNAVQSLVAMKGSENEWRIALFQTTPAQFHGRPELVQQLTDELRELI